MTIHTVTGGRQRAQQTTVDPARRLAAHRRAYDQRRRALVDPFVRDELEYWSAIVRRDPCSLCRDGHCGQMAADHIVPLDAGGENAASNVTSAGRPCNAAKKAKPLLLFLLERRATCSP